MNIQEMLELALAKIPDAGHIRVKQGDLEIEIFRDSPAAAALSVTAPAVPTVQPVAESGCEKVTAPLVGIFYVSPEPGADPFVKVGQTVKKGDTLCIIEAMKLFNEIESTSDGIVTAVLAENGAMVEFGQPLFSVKTK
ncbi:MAG: acetyl-CoA carboxylase biotin carboxyl carrier protein [Oscillospiraceae bacterium]|jgi:acetyl-CoA carboxylase biotin carboxyl carrier protein|nr:acetyl-CoA carboxylase biotin carboxyl carrier protein [Oscillospiraceae bacterium]